MEYVRLGHTGLKVSRLGFGGWLNWSTGEGEKLVKEMLDLARQRGVNFFDTAEAYGRGEAEKVLGDWLASRNVKRSTVVICTKIFWGEERGINQVGLSRKRVVEGMKASLKRLQLDAVDVVLAHRPDPETPLEETVRAFNHVIDRGWAYYWGTSEWHPMQIARAQAIAKELRMIPPQVEQPQYNMLSRCNVEQSLSPLLHCAEPLGITAWSPLASGLLSGKYNDGTIPVGSRFAREHELKVDLSWKRTLEQRSHVLMEFLSYLSALAQRLGCTQSQLVLAWCVRNPSVSVTILGATSVAQLEENLNAIHVVPKLTHDIMQEIYSKLSNSGF